MEISENYGKFTELFWENLLCQIQMHLGYTKGYRGGTDNKNGYISYYIIMSCKIITEAVAAHGSAYLFAASSVQSTRAACEGISNLASAWVFKRNFSTSYSHRL